MSKALYNHGSTTAHITQFSTEGPGTRNDPNRTAHCATDLPTSNHSSTLSLHDGDVVGVDVVGGEEGVGDTEGGDNNGVDVDTGSVDAVPTDAIGTDAVACGVLEISIQSCFVEYPGYNAGLSSVHFAFSS